DSDLMLGASWVGFSILGFALWLTIHMVFYNRRYAPDAFLPFALKTVALILMFFGVVSLMAAASGPFSIPIVVALLIVSAMAANRFRTNETRSLLCQLGICMDHGLPIIPAARAFAAERTDEIGIRANQLADRMEQGVPLADALSDSRLPMTIESRLAASQTNNSLRVPDQVRSRINEAYASIDQTTWLLQRLIYLCLVPVVGIAIWSFICIKIIPTYRQIFIDFGMELPPITLAVISISNNLVATTGGRIVVSILATFGLFFIVATFLAVLYFIGWIKWEPPLVRRITASYHGALIMRAMADAIESGKDIAASLTEVGAAYPTRYVQRRVAYAADRIEQGQEWVHAMTNERLIVRNTGAVLESASRTGNLPWALREMADSTHRRFLMRATAFSQLLTPVAIGLMAIPIGCMTIAIFLPLVQLIEALC
ncbi:MAG: type II secretion system F family protein, partial [Planctomycetota bacterium]